MVSVTRPYLSRSLPIHPREPPPPTLPIQQCARKTDTLAGHTRYPPVTRMFNILNIPQRGVNKLRRLFNPEDGFLKKVPGVIHVGANTGQEREHYASLGLNVLWVEPIRAVFEVLRSNVAVLPNQHAYCRLLADQDGIEFDLHVANNEGASSSIFDLAKHVDVWPEIHYTHDIRVTATTLAHLIDSEQIDLREYGALVLDTQGSELLVLKGAIPVLDSFQFIKAEVADFESYAGCCQMGELTEFLRQFAFGISRKMPFAMRKGGGTYYDILYRRSTRRI